MKNSKHKRKMMMRRLAASAAMGVGLAAGGVGIASASTHPTSVAHSTTATPPSSSTSQCAGGTVISFTASSLTVKQPDGTSTTYTITSSTTFKEGEATVSAAALAAGEHVAVQVSSSSATTAALIDIQLPTLVGTVTSVDGTTIVVRDVEGFSRTIVTSGSPTFTKAESTSVATLTDVTVGSIIRASGTIDSNQTTLDATLVSVGQVSPTSDWSGNLAGPGRGEGSGGGPRS